MTAIDGGSYEFLTKFRKSYAALRSENNLALEPHFIIWFCLACEQSGFTMDNSNCVSGGRYCSPDPDGDEGPITGRDMMYELLSRICIYTLYNDLWYNYTAAYGELCIKSTEKAREDCASEIASMLQIDQRRIKSCVDSSFEGSNHALDDNKILRAERKSFEKSGVYMWPTLILNGLSYKVSLLHLVV